MSHKKLNLILLTMKSEILISSEQTNENPDPLNSRVVGIPYR